MVTLLFLMVMAVTLNYWMVQADSQEIKMAATQILAQYRTQLERPLSTNFTLTAGIRNYVTVHPEMTQQQRFSDYISKPFESDRLYILLDKYLL
jgi:sensor domain CHASE-containing protein